MQTSLFRLMKCKTMSLNHNNNCDNLSNRRRVSQSFIKFNSMSKCNNNLE